MNNLIMWNLIVGFLAPNIIAIIQNPRMSSQVRALITLGIAVVGGFITAYLNGDFNLGDIVGSILTVGVAAITFYKGLWKPTGVATSIENATSKTPPTVEQAHPEDAPTPRNDIGAASAGFVALCLLAAIGVIAIVLWAAR